MARHLSQEMSGSKGILGFVGAKLVSQVSTSTAQCDPASTKTTRANHTRGGSPAHTIFQVSRKGGCFCQLDLAHPLA
jgi:hypothetical protein